MVNLTFNVELPRLGKQVNNSALSFHLHSLSYSLDPIKHNLSTAKVTSTFQGQDMDLNSKLGKL